MRKHIATKNLAHVSDGDRHAVAAVLHVLVMPSEDGGYFAQGIEIDYVATGGTESEARDHFARGFMETVKSYLRRGRDLGALYTKSSTPGELVAAYFKAAQRPEFGCIVSLDLGEQVAEDAPVPRSLNFFPVTAAA